MSQKSKDDMTGCIIVPALNEQRHIGEVVRRMLKYISQVVVIDDGSMDRTAAEAEDAGAVVLRHEHNQGKGAALNTGFTYARENGFDFVITMDADGQHDPADIPRFVEAFRRTGIPVLVGNRMGNLGSMPWIRKLTNRFMSWYLSREMKQYVPDTQCGFRLYRSDVIPFVCAESKRYAAESETLLLVAAHGIRIDSVPMAAIYADEKSRINPLKDAFRFFAMMHRYRRRNPPHSRRT